MLKGNYILAFMLNATCGIALFPINEDNRKTRINKLKKSINNGFEQDIANINNDWKNIGIDLNKSFEALRP